MIVVLLTEGFEELEALAPIDLLRRAGCDVKTVAISADKTKPFYSRTVCGAHHISFLADMTEKEISTEGLEAVILPGGMPGTLHLERSETVQRLLDYAVEKELVIGAICAAPSILGHRGLLRNKQAACFPGFEKELDGAACVNAQPVVTDGNIITAKGAGVAVEFALALITKLVSADTAKAIKEGIQCK